MKKLSFVLVALMLAFGAFSAKSAQAEQVIAVVDIQYIMNETKAAKNIREQVTSIRKKYQAEVSKKEEDLRAKEKALIEKRGSLSAEEFNKQAGEFAKKLAEAQKEVRGKQEKLEGAVNDALNELKGKAVEIIAAKAKERNASLVLPRQNIIIVSPTMDLTEDVVAEVNKKVSSIKIKAN